MSIHQSIELGSNGKTRAVNPVMSERRARPRTETPAQQQFRRAIEASKLQINLKRALDLCVAVPLVLILAPFLALVAIAIRLDSTGPVIFRQRRRGYRGRHFDILKFRTMSVMENGDNVTQAKKNDPRVTRVGAFLRKTSIDELPQLINVLFGTMSLVGPRPHPVSLDKSFAPLISDYELRWMAKPGITGLAQVNGLRGETATVDIMSKRVSFDIRYARKVDVLADILIMLKTIPAVLTNRNAY